VSHDNEDNEDDEDEDEEEERGARPWAVRGHWTEPLSLFSLLFSSLGVLVLGMDEQQQGVKGW